MARSRRKGNRDDSVDAAGTRAARHRKKRGDSSMTLWLSMGILLTLIAGGFVLWGPPLDGERETESGGASEPAVADGETSAHRPFPEVEPWTGAIGDARGSVRVGMTREQVRQQFGAPHIESTDFSRTAAGVDTWEYFENAERARIMSHGGGRRLIVKIDLGSERVVWFRPPSPPRDDPAS